MSSPALTSTTDAPPDTCRTLAGWAVTAACLIAFMGVGVVDPILPEIGHQLGATPTQVELLFTTYLGVMAIMTLFAGNIGARVGRRRVALIGLGLIAAFALACHPRAGPLPRRLGPGQRPVHPHRPGAAAGPDRPRREGHHAV